jgi:hypothetical protein
MAVIRHFITSTVCQFDMMLCRQSDTSATSKQVRQNVASATCIFDNIYVRQLGFRHNVVRHFCIRQLGLRQGNVAPPTGGIGNNTTKLGVKEPVQTLKPRQTILNGLFARDLERSMVSQSFRQLFCSPAMTKPISLLISLVMTRSNMEVLSSRGRLFIRLARISGKTLIANY